MELNYTKVKNVELVKKLSLLMRIGDELNPFYPRYHSVNKDINKIEKR